MNLFSKIRGFLNQHHSNLFLVVLLIVCSSFSNVLCSLALAPTVSVAETVANRVEVLARGDKFGRCQVRVDDKSGLLVTNQYHVRMMSYIGQNNSIFCEYDFSNTIPIHKEDQNEAFFANIYGITNCGDGYVYGPTPNPYGVSFLQGYYRPTDPLFNETATGDKGCILSATLAKGLFGDGDPLQKRVFLGDGALKTSFVVTAVVDDPCLCNGYQSNTGVFLTNFVFLNSLFEGRCSLVFRMKNDYQTNVSVFRRFFSKVYLKNYSTHKLTLETGDSGLDEFVHRVVVDGLEPSPTIYFVFVEILLQIAAGILLSIILKRAGVRLGFGSLLAIVFLYLSLSFLFSLLFNNVAIGVAFYNFKSASIVLFLLLGLFGLSFSLYFSSATLKNLPQKKVFESICYRYDL